MSKKALVSFFSLDPYLFGSELTHGNGEGANYFSKGNPLPQQTTVCGMLRHLLLEKGYDRGPNSFTPTDPKLNDYGDLLGLSPIFLTDGKEFFLREAIDRHSDRNPFGLTDENNTEYILLDSDRSGWQNARRWVWDERKHKEGLADYWVSPGITVKKPGDIFKIFIRPGIPKQELRRPKANGPGLFKQQLYRLAEGWKFCVLAEFSDSVDLTKLDGSTLPVGAEKTVFHISVQSETRKLEDFFPKENMFYQSKTSGGQRIVLVSDTWATDEVWQFVKTAVTEMTDFRHIRTHANVNRFGRLHRWSGSPEPDDQLVKSHKYLLLRRGSVLVCRDEAMLPELKVALKVEPWHRIGFNHFFTYP